MLSIEEIEILEDEFKWEQAREALLERYRTNLMDLQNVIRFGFLSWYVLVEWGCIQITEDMNTQTYQAILGEVTEAGFNNFNENPDFLWCFGYMIYLFPYYFGEFNLWQKKGINMLKKAYEKTKDPMLKMIYLGCDVQQDLKGYYDSCNEARLLVVNRFSGNGTFNHYFVQVLNRKNPQSFEEFEKLYNQK
ncbi:MAG: hypothetical protein H6653_10700 [Ardenticatenaceae bacterium]|nr:hypothetical protein [Ardenticatenaceae bacterium]